MTKIKAAKSAISVKGLRKSYGDLKVLEGISFNVQHGTIVALLGPNGAGKTTTIKILSTLLEPDGGTVSVAGYDVLAEQAKVKANIGLTGQYAAVDEYLTGEENLIMIGRLYKLSMPDIRRRTRELLELFDLVEPGKRPVKTYSGGMKRRIDLAMSLIASPPIIFLDEPTTGLDPRSRQTMWETINKLANSGVSILLTTQYMEEADNLADNIVVIDGGKVIAEGTPSALKAKVGSDRLEVIIEKKSQLDEAKKVIGIKDVVVDEERRTISVASSSGTKTFRNIMKRLDDAKITVESFSLHRPTLDDVFLKLTGHTAKSGNGEQKTKKKGKK
jgi:ABC-2 type transport system ATP-binding protein